MESERRSYGLSSTMPNLDYSTSYSGALSDVTPASHHALSTAYDDLKKRYNDLQGKYTQTAKQLREAQRRGSSPDISLLNHTSPRHGISGRSPRRGVELENGDISQTDWNLLEKERDMLQRQVSELEHKLSVSTNEKAESEHESKQLREHVSRQEEDLRQSQQLLLRTENENEDYRKQITLIKRQMKDVDVEKERERMRDMRSLSPAAGAAAGGGQSSLNSSLDCSTLGGRSSLSTIGSMENEDLASVVQTTVNVTHQMKDLLTTVHKQRDIIKTLFKRLHDEREMFQRHLDAQRRSNESAPCGVGARPKVRALPGPTPHGVAVPSAGLTLNASGRSQVVDAVPCTEDMNRMNSSKFKPPVRQRDPVKIGQHDLHSPVDSSGLMRSPERSPFRGRLIPERHSAPAAAQTSPHPLPPNDPPPTVGNELESHYDDLQIGGGVGVSWEPPHVVEDDKTETEPLLPSPRRLGRNESMEHLHDDSPPYDSLGDLGESTSGSGSTLCGTDPESEYDLPEQLLPRGGVGVGVGGGGGGGGGYEGRRDTNNASSGETENRYEASSPQPRQRSLTAGEAEPAGISPEGYTNLHTGQSWAPSSATGNAPSQSSTNQPTATRTSPVAPPRRQYRVPVERGSEGEEDEDTRNCPVCAEDFPSHMAMEEFQKHVLECPGRPERICPMCDAAFPDEVSQSQFERHVNEHFEDDVTIQNFEVLPS